MRMLSHTLLTLLSHWRRHLLQCVSLLLGLWLATALWSGIQALNSQAKAEYQRAADLFDQEQNYTLYDPQEPWLTQRMWSQLRRLGWPVAPIIDHQVVLRSTDVKTETTTLTTSALSTLRLIGIDPLSHPSPSARTELVPSILLTDFIGSVGVTLIAPSTLKRFDWQEGQVLYTQNHTKLPPLQMRDTLPPNTLIMDIGHAQTVLQRVGYLNRFVIDLDAFSQPVSDTTLPILPADPDLQALKWSTPNQEQDLLKLTNSFHLNLTAMGLLAFAVGLFIVHATLGLALEQRQTMLRTLRATGVPLSILMLALSIELISFAIIAAVLGILSGYALAIALLPDVASSLQSLYGAQISTDMRLQPSVWVSGLLMSISGVLLAGGRWLYKAKSLAILQLSQPQAWFLAEHRRLRLQAKMALLILLIAGFLLWFGNSLLSGLLLIGALLVGATLLLPIGLQWLLVGLIHGCQASRWPLLHWFWADSRQQLPGLSLALSALLLAQTANIGVSSMTEGFRVTFLQWLDQRLAAEVYVRPSQPDQIPLIQSWLTQQPHPTAVLDYYQTRQVIDGWPVEIIAVMDHPTYRDHWPLLQQEDDVWQQVFEQQQILVNEQFFYRSGLDLGETLTLNTPTMTFTARLVGVYADYGNSAGQILLANTAFRHYWPDTPLRSWAVRLDPADVTTFMTQLTQRFALPSQYVIDQSQLKRWSTSIFERTFAATGAMNSLTLLLAALALFISLLTLSQSRLSQLAPLWTAGFTPQQLARINLAQIVFLALVTTLMAIPLGLLLTWSLVSIVNVHAFGWRLPWMIFPNTLALALLLAIVTAFLAALWPGYQLKKYASIRLIKLLGNAQ